MDALLLGSRNIRRPQRKGRGQSSVSRPLIGTYDTSDVAIQVHVNARPNVSTIAQLDLGLLTSSNYGLLVI